MRIVNGEVLKLGVEGNVANVGNFNSDNGLNVNNWNPANRNDNLFAAPLIAFGEKKIIWNFAWRILSIPQASCLFPEDFLEELDNFYCLLLGCLLKDEPELLIDPA